MRSCAVDTLEGAALGTMFTGGRPGAAAAEVFPSLVVLEQVLPQHFGWKGWTEEALFWKRPRLHAFFELMKYEPVAQEIQKTLTEKIAALEVALEVTCGCYLYMFGPAFLCVP